MDGGNWRGEAWPAPEARARQRLPRVEDLVPAEHGYDRERVHEAFDSFYRHIAQLDSTVRALEAVEVFRDQAGELRRELRALKAAGWTQQPWPAAAPARTSPGLPESLPRFAIEAAFLIVVAVVVAVSGFDRLSIVLVMALAWAIVGVVEWAASRERFARARAVPPARPRAEEAAAPAPLRIVPPARSAPAESWDAPAALPAAPQDERTVVGSAQELEEPEPEAAPEVDVEVVEVAAEVDVEPVLTEPELLPEPEPEPEPEPIVAEAEVVEEANVVEEAEVVAEAEAPEAEAPEAELEAEADAEPEESPARWSWAADSTVERARERELAKQPLQPRRRFWQRRNRHVDGVHFEAAQPKHVRVLPPEPSFDEQFPVDGSHRADPWEQDLDLSIEEPEGPVDAEQPVEREAALDHRTP